MKKKPALERCMHVEHLGRAGAPVTCELPKEHKGRHKAGYVSWPNNDSITDKKLAFEEGRDDRALCDVCRYTVRVEDGRLVEHWLHDGDIAPKVMCGGTGTKVDIDA